MSVLQSIKTRLFGSERETEIGFMPKHHQDMRDPDKIPKFTLRKEVNGQGQIYLPKETRHFEARADVEPGDDLSIDVFGPAYGGMNLYKRMKNRKYHVNVTVAKGNRITIPAEVRRELDIREGDEIAIHAHHQFMRE